jgi:hypothetical protein
MALAIESDRVMFEIYREAAYNGRYKVVYFTELTEHNRETEINNAMRGEHFFDGFIRNYGKEQAKQVINKILERLNNGEVLAKADVERELRPFMP